MEANVMPVSSMMASAGSPSTSSNSSSSILNGVGSSSSCSNKQPEHFKFDHYEDKEEKEGEVNNNESGQDDKNSEKLAGLEDVAAAAVVKVDEAEKGHELIIDGFSFMTFEFEADLKVSWNYISNFLGFTLVWVIWAHINKSIKD